jgi:hypothetical protein
MKSAQQLAKVRKRRLVARQIAVFGALAGMLAVAGVGSYRMFTGESEPIFSAPFTSPSPPDLDFGPVPCPAAGATYPSPSRVTINALNSTNFAGAAGSAGHSMESRGFQLGDVADTPMEFAGSILVRAGALGIDNAYAVLAHTPDNAILAFDPREDDSVDVVVGLEYDGLRPAEEVAVASGQAILPPAGCVAVAEIEAEIAAEEAALELELESPAAPTAPAAPEDE